jgi:hypothetical protein
MSIIRWGEQDSNVYIYEDMDGRLVCCACDGPNAVTTDTAEMMVHLKWHRDQGHIVPSCVDERIQEGRMLCLGRTAFSKK